VGSSDLVSPVSSSNGDNRELSENDGSSDSSRDFLSALDSKSNMSVSISNDDESFESGSLSGSSLLLNGHDLHNLILDLGSKEVIDDLVFLDRESEKIDLLELGNVSSLDQSSQLGDGRPNFGILVVSSSSSGGSSSASSSTTSASIFTISSSASSSTSSSKSSSAAALIG